MDSLELSFSRDLAIMVYHYLLEWRMENLAQVFAATCPILAVEEGFPDHGLLSVIPYRRLHDAMWEYSKLLESMRQTIQQYHSDVPIPFGATSWDKIKYLIDYFSTLHSTQATAGDGEGNGTATVFNTEPTSGSPTNGNDGANVGTEDVYQLVNLNQPAALSLLSDHHHPPTAACASNTSKESATTKPPVMLLVQNCEGQQLDGSTYLITMDNSGNPMQLSGEMPAENPMRLISLDQNGVIHQQVELNSVMMEQPNQNPPAPALPSLPILDADDGSEVLVIEKPVVITVPKEDAATSSGEVEKPATFPTEPDNNSSQPEASKLTTALPSLEENTLQQESQTSEQSMLASQATKQVVEVSSVAEPITMDAEPVATSSTPSIQPAQQQPASSKKPIDLEALEEWNQLRMINWSNMDNHIRKLNYEQELMQAQQKADEQLPARKKKGTAKKANLPAANIRTVVKQEKSPPKASTVEQHKMKSAQQKKKKNGEPFTPPKTRTAAAVPKQPPLGDSDSSDFASSPDEDAGVRQMVASVKQYRKQKKKLAAKENKAVESASQSNIPGTPSASLSLCRPNLIVGRTASKSPVKRSLRKHTPSTSPVGTPAKRTKQSPTVAGNTATVPSSATTTTHRRINPANLAKKMKQTDQQNVATAAAATAAAKATPPAGDTTSLQPALAPLSPKNRRPVRACTMNRKAVLTASTPLKQPETEPNAENMPPPGMLGSPMEANPTADTEVAVFEEAIYAVLAQLHGD